MIYPVKRYPMTLWNRFIPEEPNKHLAVDIMNDNMDPVYLMANSVIEGVGRTKTHANYILVYLPDFDVYISYVHTTVIPGLEHGKLLMCGTQEDPFIVGRSDTSGATSEGAHLHFTLLDSNEHNINPLPWFKENGLQFKLDPAYKKKLIGKGVNVEELENIYG